MKFSQLMKITREDLIVSHRHEKWLHENTNPVYSDEAIAFMLEQLKKPPRVRKGTVSASSLESCRRRQEFTYLGWPELAPPSKLAQILHNGMYMHLRWQMAGLTAGWLAKAEVKVPENEFRVSGTMDGITDNGEVVEFKSINTNGFNQITTFGPKKEHRVQIGTYMYLTEVERGALIYEDKNTQEYREFVVELNEDLVNLVEQSANDIWGWIDTETLVHPLSDCEARLGYRYNGCPYRDRCLEVKTWKQAKSLSS